MAIVRVRIKDHLAVIRAEFGISAQQLVLAFLEVVHKWRGHQVLAILIDRSASVV